MTIRYLPKATSMFAMATAIGALLVVSGGSAYSQSNPTTPTPSATQSPPVSSLKAQQQEPSAQAPVQGQQTMTPSAQVQNGQTAQATPPAASSTTTAQSPAPATKMKKMHHARVPMTDRVEQQITKEHAELQITANEEQAWGNVAQAMRDTAKNLDDLAKKRHDTYKNANAVDNLTSHQQFLQALADGEKNVLAAVTTLYNQMPDSQKKVADAVFRSEHVRGPGMKPHHHKHAAPASK